MPPPPGRPRKRSPAMMAMIMPPRGRRNNHERRPKGALFQEAVADSGGSAAGLRGPSDATGLPSHGGGGHGLSEGGKFRPHRG